MLITFVIFQDFKHSIALLKLNQFRYRMCESGYITRNKARNYKTRFIKRSKPVSLNNQFANKH